jgi:hypothetical protein
MPTRFDLAALYHAIDARRLQRNLAWPAAAAEIGLPPATVKAAKHAKTMEADGVLAMVRWLEVPPEEFVLPRRRGRVRTDLPANKMWRVDTRRIYAHLLAAKQKQSLTWAAMAAEIGTGVTAASLTRLANGGRISINLFAALAAWLDEPIDNFTYVSEK